MPGVSKEAEAVAAFVVAAKEAVFKEEAVRLAAVEGLVEGASEVEERPEEVVLPRGSELEVHRAIKVAAPKPIEAAAHRDSWEAAARAHGEDNGLKVPVEAPSRKVLVVGRMPRGLVETAWRRVRAETPIMVALTAPM
jgi:hypothetical protein